MFVSGRPPPPPPDDDSSDEDGTGARDQRGLDAGQQIKYSLCWHDPQLVIKLVDNCPNITVLDLEGKGIEKQQQQ